MSFDYNPSVVYEVVYHPEKKMWGVLVNQSVEEEFVKKSTAVSHARRNAKRYADGNNTTYLKVQNKDGSTSEQSKYP